MADSEPAGRQNKMPQTFTEIYETSYAFLTNEMLKYFSAAKQRRQERVS
jgi:hypothetical protein